MGSPMTSVQVTFAGFRAVFSASIKIRQRLFPSLTEPDIHTMFRGSVNKAGTQLFLPSTCGCLIIPVLLYGLPSQLLACYCSCSKRQRRVHVYSSAPSPVGHNVSPLSWLSLLSPCLLKQQMPSVCFRCCQLLPWQALWLEGSEVFIWVPKKAW